MDTYLPTRPLCHGGAIHRISSPNSHSVTFGKTSFPWEGREESEEREEREERDGREGRV